MSMTAGTAAASCTRLVARTNKPPIAIEQCATSCANAPDDYDQSFETEFAALINRLDPLAC
jgi:hypothetical protein